MNLFQGPGTRALGGVTGIDSEDTGLELSQICDLGVCSLRLIELVEGAAQRDLGCCRVEVFACYNIGVIHIEKRVDNRLALILQVKALGARGLLVLHEGGRLEIVADTV